MRGTLIITTQSKNGKGEIPLGAVNFSLLAAQVREASANTNNLGQGELDGNATVNVGVKNTQDVREFGGDDERLQETQYRQIVNTATHETIKTTIVQLFAHHSPRTIFGWTWWLKE